MFQKWLGFIIFDVNSCSNLAFLGQQQCQGWPSEPRWQENLLGKQVPTKRHSHNHTIVLVFSGFLTESCVIVTRLTREPSAVTDGPELSSLLPYRSRLQHDPRREAGESVSPAAEVTACLLPSTLCKCRLVENDTAHLRLQ